MKAFATFVLASCFAIACFVLLPLLCGCAVDITPDGTTFAPAASTSSVKQVAKMVQNEQTERQVEDMKIRNEATTESNQIRSEIKTAADELAAGRDPAAILQAFQDAADKRLSAALTEAANRQKEQKDALEAKIATLEQGMDSQENLMWLLGLGGLGLGGGAVGVAGRRKTPIKVESTTKTA